MTTVNIIEARDLVLSFGETPALRGASLGVRPGEIVAVMGPSGSGKSTLLHCLAGILVPDEGEVWFGGQRLDTLSDDRRSALRRDRFGFVFQSGQLVPELTADENVALPLLLSGTRRGPAMTAARKWFGTLGLDGPSTIGDLVGHDNSTNDAYQQLANTVILVSLPIAGCTLAAGIAAGLADRKRPFSLLRLTGARLGTLRRVVALEGAVPLLAVAVVAIGTGFGAAAMNASLQQNHSIVAPGAAYYLITAGGILAALGIIAATFPLLARITGPEVARNE